MLPVGLLVLHGGLIVGAGCTAGYHLELILYQAFGPLHNVFFSSTSLLILPCALVTAGIASLLAGVSYIRRIQRKGRRVKFRLQPRFQISSYAAVALFAFLAFTAVLETFKRASFTTTALSLSLTPLPVLLLTHCLFDSRIPLATYAPTFPLLLGFGTYLWSLPAPRTIFDQTDLAASTALISAFTIISPLLYHTIAIDFPSTFSRRVLLAWPACDAKGRRWDPLDKRVSSLIDLTLFSSVLLCVLALVGTYITFVTTSEVVVSLNLLDQNPTLVSALVSFALAATLAALVVASSISIFGAWRTTGLVGLAVTASAVFNTWWADDWSQLNEVGWAGVALAGLGMLLVACEPGVGEGLADRDESEEEYLELGQGLEEKKLRGAKHDDLAPQGVRLTSRRYYLVVYLLPMLTIVVPIIPYPRSKPSSWDAQLYRLTSHDCSARQPVRWNGTVRTALVSNPRSGNTFVRSLVEETTGFQTSTVGYCDLVLAGTFHGECDHRANFLVKTHYPARVSEVDHSYADLHDITQVVHLVRNPIDTLHSWWHLAHVSRDRHDQYSHSGRVILPKGQLLGSTPEQLNDLTLRAKVWLHHDNYWHGSPLPRHPVRYEDLSLPSTRLPTLIGLLSFLLPPVTSQSNDISSDLPDLATLSCLARSRSPSEAYRSRKSLPFASWDKWDPVAREKILTLVQPGWCRHGFDGMAKEKFATGAAAKRVSAAEAKLHAIPTGRKVAGSGVVAGGRLGERAVEPVGEGEPQIGDWELLCEGPSADS